MAHPSADAPQNVDNSVAHPTGGAPQNYRASTYMWGLPHATASISSFQISRIRASPVALDAAATPRRRRPRSPAPRPPPPEPRPHPSRAAAHHAAVLDRAAARAAPRPAPLSLPFPPLRAAVTSPPLAVEPPWARHEPPTTSTRHPRRGTAPLSLPSLSCHGCTLGA